MVNQACLTETNWVSKNLGQKVWNTGPPPLSHHTKGVPGAISQSEHHAGSGFEPLSFANRQN
jgi:hypothetical protein